MIYKMPGSEFEKFANLRLLYTYMFTHPGAKLLFMGNEFAQTKEWNYDSELQWELLQFDPHHGMQECVRRLNHLYRTYPSLYELQFDKKGFAWEDISKPEEGIIIYRRKTTDRNKDVVIILNVSDQALQTKEIFLKGKNAWQEIFNTDDIAYWGSGNYINENIICESVDKKKKLYKITIAINAFTAIVLY